MYHIIYIPEVHDRTRHSAGNGGKTGCIEGHRTKSLEGSGILSKNGCKYHPDCFTCPFDPDDCHFEYERERKRLKNNGKNHTP